MNAHGYGDIIAAIVIVAIVYVLVRPRSAGVELVAAVGSLFQAMVRGAVDMASDGGSQ